jgi:hypothetical protein
LAKADHIYEHLTGFEPQSKGQEALHAVTLTQFNIPSNTGGSVFTT